MNASPPPASRASSRRIVTRLAPSPTGALHLGNARTFLINHAHAIQRDAHVILRIEDLDTPRTKPDAERQAIDLLRWLGMTWDQGPYVQTRDLSPYQAALDTLQRQGRAYPCDLSRKDVEQAASAPHADDAHDASPTSRHRLGEPLPRLGTAQSDNVRLRVDEQDMDLFVDAFAGEQTQRLHDDDAPDFVIATKAGLPSYQLAVVVDDARQGVTDIVRGDDLIDSAHRQRLLQRLLGYRHPTYWHVPLVVGVDGRRLAKRHGDTRVDRYRDQGVSAQRVIGWVAWTCGICDEPCEMTLDDFVARFDWAKLSHEPWVFTAEQDAWLKGRG